MCACTASKFEDIDVPSHDPPAMHTSPCAKAALEFTPNLAGKTVTKVCTSRKHHPFHTPASLEQH